MRAPCGRCSSASPDPEREPHATPALHRRPHRAAGLAEEVLRGRDQPAHRRMGKGRDLSGQGAVPQDGQARLPGREQAGRIRRPGPGLQLCRGLCRRPERHPVRRRADGHRRADRHGHAGAGALRLRRGAQGVPRAVDQRRLRGLPGRVGSRRRLRRGLDQDPCAQGRRRLRHQRRQDVDHQRHPGRLVLRARQHQRRCFGPPQQDADLRADEDARRRSRAQAEEGGHELVGHGAAALRQRARAAALAHRRRGHGLHLPDAAVPGRAPVGRGRLAQEQRSHPGDHRLPARAPGLRQAAAGQPVHLLQAGRAADRGRGDGRAVPQGGGAVRGRQRRDAAGLDVQAEVRAPGARGGRLVRAVLGRHGLHRGDARQPRLARHRGWARSAAAPTR